MLKLIIVVLFSSYVFLSFAYRDRCLCNEQFSECIQGVCRAEHCAQKGQLVPCPDIAAGQCIAGYVCREGYLRDNSGTCIPEDQCPAPLDCSALINEEYQACPPLCPSDNCSLPRLKGVCPFRIGIVLPCKPKCQCKDGYGRNDEGICVPFEECPNLCPTNEEYSSCTQALCRPQSCAERNSEIACPAVDEASCERGCVCKENFYRNLDGECVPIDQCEQDPRCPYPYETYTEKKASCPPDTCISLVIRINCIENQTIKPGCICDSGRLRLNGTSPCIPICECPEMKSSPDCQSTEA